MIPFFPCIDPLAFMVARVSAAQEGSSSVARSPNIVGSYKFTTVYCWKCQKCSGDCTSFFELINPSPITNSDFPTEIVYWSRVMLCKLYHFIPRFSGVGIILYPCPSVPEYVSVEKIENASTEIVEI